MHMDPVRSPAYSDAGRENHDNYFHPEDNCTVCNGFGYDTEKSEMFNKIRCDACAGTGKRMEIDETHCPECGKEINISSFFNPSYKTTKYKVFCPSGHVDAVVEITDTCQHTHPDIERMKSDLLREAWTKAVKEYYLKKQFERA